MSTIIKNVLVIGAAGNVGTAVLNALEKNAQFKISVLSRASSKADFGSHIKVIKIADEYPESELSTAFQGQDAIVCTFGRATFEVQKAIIDTAIRAGVKHFIPSEFGSDTTNATAREMVPIFNGKYAVIEYLESQQSKTSMTWSGITTGPFFDFCLNLGLFKFDLKSRSATIYDGGNVPFSTTNLANVGQAVAATLTHPTETANRHVYVADYLTTQNEILAALESASDGQKWSVQHDSVDNLLASGREKLAAGQFMPGMFDALLAAVLGKDTGRDFSVRAKADNALLGLKAETLDDVVKRVVKG
ncbi:hypothetical protein MMC09_001915 [Bachmanniomyces sp. S44760]|nr:hypothetical protein [Bachmanniomyces sp. S44760]